MKAVFLDTVGLIAIWEKSDQWHRDALDAYQLILTSRSLLVSTTFVLLECANSASRRPYRNEVDALRKMLVNLNGLVFPSDEDWQVAWDEYRAGYPGSPGVCDLVSFRVMRDMDVTDVFSNDKHFKAAGFNTLF